jgi:hypothetical protein
MQDIGRNQKTRILIKVNKKNDIRNLSFVNTWLIHYHPHSPIPAAGSLTQLLYQQKNNPVVLTGSNRNNKLSFLIELQNPGIVDFDFDAV